MNEIPRDVESFIEQLPVGIIVLDSGFQMCSCNNLALDLLGIDIENCLIGTFIDAIQNKELKEALLAASIGETKQQSKIILEIADRTVACTVKTTPNGFIVIVEDATQLRGLERLKREFIGSLLHRIRNPLSTLKTSLAMVQDGRMGALPPDVAEILGMGYHEVNRLTALLTDMNDLFQIETGLACKDLVIETFSVAKVLERAVAVLQTMDSPLNTVQQRLKISGELDTKITADFDKAKRIFKNILKNALCYSDENTAVELTCRAIEGYAEITIRDHGPGIAENMVPLVFTKFFREDTPNTRAFEGNGLGLFIAKSFTELMGGSMYCESVPGKGTAISLALPV